MAPMLLLRKPDKQKGRHSAGLLESYFPLFACGLLQSGEKLLS